MASGVAYTAEETESIKKTILNYLNETPGGTFAAACKLANVGHTWAYDLRGKDPLFGAAVAAAMKEADRLGGDFAESKLMKKINEDDTTCILFYLKTKHKHRGYVEKSQTDFTFINHEEAIEQLNELE